MFSITKWFYISLLYVNTLRRVKISQIYYLIGSKLKIRNKTDLHAEPCTINYSENWENFSLLPERITKAGKARFLNVEDQLIFPQIWRDNTKTKLWLYNLHYFEDFVGENNAEKAELHRTIFDRWIQDNPPFEGVGWDPYPTSLRIVNIFKFWLGGQKLSPSQLKSIYLQANFLFQNLELHLLGNHYFVNLKALIFSGVVFDRTDWLEYGVEKLSKEIDEQVLTDGAHFELSPMYHALIIVDILDLINLAAAYKSEMFEEIVPKLRRTVAKMIAFLDVVSLGDGRISFFNDAAFGIAPEVQRIHDYADALSISSFKENECSLDPLPDSASGYIALESVDIKILFDAAEVGPTYIPGHAHADVLSVEVSIGRHRVIVNSGTSTYQDLALRKFQRSTRAHSTVEVNETDSSEVWASFRVGSRSKILKRELKCTQLNHVFAEASHDGYSTLLQRCIHNRCIDLSPNSFTITDTLLGKYRTATCRYYFHPSIRITETAKSIIFTGEGFEMILDAAAFSYSLSPAKYFPEFGVEQKNWCLEIRFDKPSIVSNFIINR